MIAAIQKLNEPVVLSEWDKDGHETKRTARCIFDGITTYRLGKNLKLLKAESASITEAREGMFRQRDPDGEGALKGKVAVEFQRELKKLLNETVELDLLEIPIADLKPGKNPIGADVLSELIGTILTGEITA